MGQVQKFQVLIISLLISMQCQWFHRWTVGNASQVQTNVIKDLPEIDIEPLVKIGEKFYFIESKYKLNWYDANHDCRRRNAQLGSIQSAEEFNALAAYLSSKNWNIWLWLSGNDLAKEGEFHWLGTGKPISYARWASGQPDNRQDNENCVQLLWHNEEWLLNDQDCARPLQYICEAKMPKVVALTIWNR